MPSFIGIDGEGETLADGRHVYTLLAASTGDLVRNPNGLDFAECMRFLLFLKRDNPGATFVGFGFGYDSNMILQSEGLALAGQLLDADNKPIVHPLYGGLPLGMRWIPRRELWVKPYIRAWDGPGLQVWDVLGFFQMPFLKALKDAGIGAESELSEIENMKAHRSRFDRSVQERIERYCLTECRLLVTLMDSLADAVDQLGWNLSRWDGAGALAGAMLRLEKVKEHSLHGTVPEGFSEAVMSAYFGGRFETFQIGEIGPIWTYDIRSAYPSAARSLPCLRHARIRQTNRYTGALGVYRVRFDAGPGVVGALPWRNEQGRIVFPRAGEGWYWTPELEALRAWRVPFTVLDGWRVHTTDNCTCHGKPFAWISEAYEARAAYKRAGDSRQKPLKLAINAVYGKLAQGIGNASHQNYVWAGLITSETRARVFDLAMRDPKHVIYIATDGLAFSKPQNVECLDVLGGWEAGYSPHCFSVANGQRLYLSEHGEWSGKTRGYGADERIPWDQLREEWKRAGVGANVAVPVTRFIGASLARHRNRPDLWCTWHTEERRLSALLGWSRAPVDKLRGKVVRTQAWDSVDGPSAPYTPKRNRLAEMTEEMQEIVLANEDLFNDT